MSTDNKEKEIQNKAEEAATEAEDAQANEKKEVNEDADGSNTGDEHQEELTEVEKLENELKAANDKYLRLYSEFENFRRRTAKEKLEMISNASEGIIKDVLPILDDLGRAVKNNEDSKDLEAVKEGVKIIYQKFSKTLENKGVTKMDAHEKDFDPEYHEALTKIPAPDKKLKGKNIDVIEEGYLLNEKVVRFAKVVVGE